MFADRSPRSRREKPFWEFKTPTGQFRGGIMICYDREMPESPRILMLKGADVIFNPLACNCPTDDIHRCLLRTRAFENEVYIFMVNHAAPRQNGHSMVFDFTGKIAREMDEKEGVFVHELDLDALKNTARRASMVFTTAAPSYTGFSATPPDKSIPTTPTCRRDGEKKNPNHRLHRFHRFCV